MPQPEYLPATIPLTQEPTQEVTKVAVLPLQVKTYIKGAPRIERPEHRSMYAFYERLGGKRSLRKVAREFSRSMATISLISRAFNWQDRICQYEAITKDPIVTVSKPKMDNARLDIVCVVEEITTILGEMTKLAKAIRKGAKDEMSGLEKDKMKALINALSVYGIRIRTPKDLRDMVGTLKDVMEFGKASPISEGSLKSAQVNVDTMNLVIQED